MFTRVRQAVRFPMEPMAPVPLGKFSQRPPVGPQRRERAVLALPVEPHRLELVPRDVGREARERERGAGLAVRDGRIPRELRQLFQRGRHPLVLGARRRPLRKFSERNGGHWFHGEPDGLSYAGSVANLARRPTPGPKRARRPSDRSDRSDIVETETISPQAIVGSSLQRTALSPHLVEKEVIKGTLSMPRVGATLPRLF